MSNDYHPIRRCGIPMPAGNSRGEGDDDLQLTAEMISSSDGVERDEISDCDSSFGSFRSSTSTSVSEYRWRPSQEIEEIDEGWTVFSRTSSSRTSVSSFSTTQPQTRSSLIPIQQQTRRRNWMNWLFRSPDVKGKPTSIDDLPLKDAVNVATTFDHRGYDGIEVDKSIETIMIGDFRKGRLFVDELMVATPFDHRGYDGIKRIIIDCDRFVIYSMCIQYTKKGELEWSKRVEESDGGDHEIVLDYPREYITKVKGYISCDGPFIGVTSLTFFTNRETYGPFGTQQRDESRKDVYPFEYSGGKLVGFKGSSYEDMYSKPYIYSIGFYVQSPPQSCEKCGGKYIISSATTSTSERVPNVNHQTTREIQQIISVRQFGISNSSFRPFDHGGGYDGIKRIFVQFVSHIVRSNINYLKVEYMKNGEPQLTDGIGKMNMKDSATEVVLDYPNEFLQAVTGTTSDAYGLTSLTFHSNLKTTFGPFGRKFGFPFEVSRGKIIGFQGEASERALMAIGFHVVPTNYPISLLCDTCEADVRRESKTT